MNKKTTTADMLADLRDESVLPSNHLYPEIQDRWEILERQWAEVKRSAIGRQKRSLLQHSYWVKKQSMDHLLPKAKLSSAHPKKLNCDNVLKAELEEHLG